MFPVSKNYAYVNENHDFSEIPMRRIIFHKFNFTTCSLNFNAEHIKLLEKNYKKQLILEQHEILNSYSKNNKINTGCIEPMYTDDEPFSESSHRAFTTTDLENLCLNELSKKNDLNKKNVMKLTCIDDKILTDTYINEIFPFEESNCNNKSNVEHKSTNKKIRRQNLKLTKLINMNNEQKDNIRKKEALRKKQSYWKNKNEQYNKLEEKKLKRKHYTMQKIQSMNSDKLKEEKRKEAFRKKEAYHKTKIQRHDKLEEKK